MTINDVLEDWHKKPGSRYCSSDHIRKIFSSKTYKLKDKHEPCPFCGSQPTVQEIQAYEGASNHKWSCCWDYYRNILCPKCGFQTSLVKCRSDYDDADTYYPGEEMVPKEEFWKEWDDRNSSLRKKRVTKKVIETRKASAHMVDLMLEYLNAGHSEKELRELTNRAVKLADL